jgi:hypothetical protein
VTSHFPALPESVAAFDENLGFVFAAISRTISVAYLKQCKIYSTRGVAWKES